MTIAQIQTDLARAGKPSSEAQLRRYFTALGIKRQGARQRPAQYPDNATARIMAHLTGSDLPPLDTAAARVAKLPSMSQLRNVRKKARAK